MDTQNHPGKGLSLSQLIFALNQELKLAAYSPSFSLEHVSQFDLEMSAALSAIREWRNSFTHINRIPLDVLSLIPTHLSSQRDRLHASFVCRHWRRAFLQRAELWSQVFLKEDEIYAKTFLERAKGSALDLTVGPEVSNEMMALFSSRTQQIRRLIFAGDEWADIESFLEINPGPLPLLHTLEINPTEQNDLRDLQPPIPPLFGSAVNLGVFHFHCASDLSSLLRQFFFPNLVSFEFSTMGSRPSRGLDLLDFLESSPMLQTVHMDIGVETPLDGIPHNKVVTLPNVEEFNLTMYDGATGYRIASHISCPAAKHVSFTHKAHIRIAVPTEPFPAPAQWTAIAHQYTRKPIEDVTLEMNALHTTSCRITFGSANSTVIDLGFKIVTLPKELVPLSLDAHGQIFAQAARVVRDYPWLADVKRLSICHDFICGGNVGVPCVVNKIGRLFKSLHALDVLTIHCCDLRPYLHSFAKIPVKHLQEPVVFPPTKELKIVCPYGLEDGELTAAIVGLAESQHVLGVPFERVEIRYERMPEGMEEGLKPWVGSVEYSYMDIYL